MALVFISHFNRIGISVAGNARIMDQYHISPTQMGRVYSAFLIVYTICMTPGGFFIDRFGARKALMFMGFGSACLAVLTGMVGFGLVLGGQVLLTFILIRAVMGFFTTPLHPASARMVGNWAPSTSRSLANGLVNGAALLGIACTFKLFGALIDAFDWPLAFMIAAGATAVLTLIWAWYATDFAAQHSGSNDAERELIAAGATGHGKHSPIRFDDFIAVMKNRSIILLTVGYAAVGYFQYMFFYWMEYYFLKVLNLDKGTSQLYSTIPLLAMAIGMSAGGWFSDHLHRTHGSRMARTIMPFTSMLASGVFLGLGILTKQPEWIVIWFSLALGAMGACEGPFWATTVEHGGTRGGIAAAILNTGGNAGGALAPALTPWISERFGWPAGISIGVLGCVIGAACWMWIVPCEASKD